MINYENYVSELKIPENINTIAIPLEWLVLKKSNEMITIRKATIMMPPKGCGRHSWYSAKLNIMPEPAGIRLINGMRKLRYAELYAEKISHGYLVFERTNEGWLITDEREPEAFIYVISYEITSRRCSAKFEVLSTNVIEAQTNSANCRANGMASIFLLLPTNGEFIIEYKKTTGAYRGPCEEVIKKEKIRWNNGEPLAETFN